IGFLINLGAIYFGALAAQLEYVDIWRCALVSFLSYFVMWLLAWLIFPLLAAGSAAGGAELIHSKLFVVVYRTVVVGVAAALTSKVVLSCDWKPAWTIGGVAGAANAIAALLFYSPED